MPRPKRLLPDAKGMIVAPQPEAANAGADVLRAGGNAMDAVLTCALVQGVVDPLMCGIGGFGIMHVYDPATGTQTVLSGLGRCPMQATPDMWADRYQGETTDGFGFILRGFVNECGAEAISTRPIVDLFDKAHRKYGSLPWESLFGPGIACARDGWLMRPHVHSVLVQDERKYGRLNYSEKLAITEEGAALYLDPDGSVKRPGSRIVNPNLATTLEQLASGGAESFYRGALARQMIDDIRANGGILSMADLASCEAEESAPIDVDYHGYRVSTVGAPGGGLYIAQALRVLEKFDLTGMGYNTPGYLQVLAEVMKTATRDKDTKIADPEFEDVPLDELLSDAYAQDCADFIRSGGKVDTGRTGRLESRHTTHVSCMDSNGMVVSLTHTLGNPSGFVVRDAGYMMNGCMASFDPRPGRKNSIAPGKRRSSTMCPTIIFDGERPVMTLGAPGASWIGPAVLQVILNVLDWGMGIQEAISAPRMVATSNLIDISNRFPPATEQQLGALGYDVRRTHLTYAFAGVHGLTRWEDGIEGGADPQRDGMAVGVAS